MLHPIFQIDELLILIIGELVETSPKATVAFALTCRSLEVPTLSSLWQHRNSFWDLLKVLPQCVTSRFSNSYYLVIETDPSPEDWIRLQRYASWMHELKLMHGLGIRFPWGDPWHKILSLLSCNTRGGLLFPNLKRLIWNICDNPSGLIFFRLFLSPQLQCVTLFSYSEICGLPPDDIAALVHMMLFLPPSLERLLVFCGQRNRELLQNIMSSFVCQRGPSLEGLGTSIPLSEAATLHLMQLPNLSYFNTSQGPPSNPPAFIFPSLELLHLNHPEALSWVRFLESHEQGGFLIDSALVPRSTNVRDRLKSLKFPEDTIIDSRLLSSVVKFRNLVNLRTKTECPYGEGCLFPLTDDNIGNLAAELPRLKTLQLGSPCSSNTCKTTITSLMSISVKCLNLETLEIHFDTRAIARDMQRLLSGCTGHEKTKCKLRCLSIWNLPLRANWDECGTVAKGLKVIFPCLTEMRICKQVDYIFWRRVQLRLQE